MSFETFDIAILEAAKQRREFLEKHFNAAVVFYAGPLFSLVPHVLRDFLDDEVKQWPAPAPQHLVFVLNTPGGTAEAAERMVTVLRHHFKEVSFVVPDQAMSAGTILCMSGDRILMEYSSSLGPIDPQVQNKDGDLVPAVGYLNQVGKMVQKGQALTVAEMTMVQNIDLAWLDLCEKSQELGVQLVKKWLVQYKFSTWKTHRSDPAKKGQPVTQPEKEERAEQIARSLSSNEIWHSHGRPINIQMLRADLRLEIDDYSQDVSLRENIRSFHDLLIEHMRTRQVPYLMLGRTRG